MEVNKVVLKKLTMRHYHEVLKLWKQTEGVYTSDSDSPEKIRKFLKRNPGLSFIAYNEGKAAGAILCGHDGRRGYLHHLAVRSEFRRKGIE